MNIAVNNDLIFTLEHSKITVLDCKSKRKFILKRDYFERLLFWDEKSQAEPVSLTASDLDLLKGGLLVDQEKEHDWHGEESSRLFHLLTRDVSSDILLDEENFKKQYFNFSQGRIPPERFEHVYSEIVLLPEVDLKKIEGITLYESFKNRMTSRNFDGTALSQEDLSTLLFVNFGDFHKKSWSDLKESGFSSRSEHKVVPSASGLQTYEAYVCIMNVEGLSCGVYTYDMFHHALKKIKDAFISPDELVQCLMGQFWVKGISVGIFLVGDLRRVWLKDPSIKGYTSTYLDAGHLSQNILLTASGLQILTFISGAFNDKLVEEKLVLCKDYLFSPFFIGLGNGKRTPIPDVLY